MIIDHWGRVLQRLPRDRGCVLADIDLGAQAEVRSNFPALQHRALAAIHS
jgi:predicted amidohydrolase